MSANVYQEKKRAEKGTWSEDDLHPSHLSPFFRWWYGFTSIPFSGEDVSIAERESIRKSRFLSAIVLALLLIFIMFIPGCFMLPNRFVIVADLGMIPVCMLALLLNRNRKSTLAGWLLVVAFEAALVMVVLTTVPLDEPSIQQYELFVFGELLAVSLLSPRTVFFVALFNSVFIAMSLLYQEQTLILMQSLQTQFYPILLRPIGVQILVAGVTYLWVSNATKYMHLSYQARQEALEQKEEAETSKLRLQQNIERLSQAYAQSVNQRHYTPVPLEQYDQSLWQVIGTYNALQKRLQGTELTQNELHNLKQAIQFYTKALLAQKNPHLLRQPIQTKTDLDPFLAALREQMRA